VVKLSSDLARFCKRIGHDFATPDFLIRALTHPSISSPTRPDNQRMEFLGDRVLGLVMAEALLSEDEQAAEGILAPRFNALVRKEMCAEVAREIDLGAVLKLGKSEMKSGGRRRDKLLGDGMEAVIAAVYLDGGFEAARSLILRLWASKIAAVDEDAQDAKSALQEFAQARGETPPSYEVIAREGPDHAPEFTIEVAVATGETARAKAGSKRLAEHLAAQLLLESLGT
jgi:ribonuclease-3